MSTPNRRARRTAERELKRLERRLTTDPVRPILRAAERIRRQPSSPLPPGGGPGRGGDPPDPFAAPPASSPDATVSVAAPPSSPPDADGSTFPLWARLLTLPPDLDPTYRAFLFRYIQTAIAPRDDHEHWLAARIAVAMARLHVNAQREPESPSPAWLRYEALAERQLRAAHRDLKAHRASAPPSSDQQLPTSSHREPVNSAQSARPELRAPRPEVATAHETDRGSAAVLLRPTEPGCHAHVLVSVPKGGATVASHFPNNTLPAFTPRSPAAPV